MTTTAQVMPYVWELGEQMGNAEATERIQAHLLGIVDRWAESQPLPPAVEPLPGAVPSIDPAKTHTEHISVTKTPAWPLYKPKRIHGYTAPLHRFLAAARQQGKPRPSARDVLESWRTDPPAEIAKVLTDSMDYYDNKDGTKTADTEAIQEAINRMTKPR
jgi:hypothetical protein